MNVKKTAKKQRRKWCHWIHTGSPGYPTLSSLSVLQAKHQGQLLVRSVCHVPQQGASWTFPRSAQFSAPAGTSPRWSCMDVPQSRVLLRIPWLCRLASRDPSLHSRHMSALTSCSDNITLTPYRDVTSKCEIRSWKFNRNKRQTFLS